MEGLRMFKNVTVSRAANLYFEGNVSSRTLILDDGKKVTLGIMLPGTYKFGTSAKERMEITAGKLSVLLPGESAQKEMTGGSEFEVPANSEFSVTVTEVVDYCCHYID
jgi:uncharacterized protein YaiE (UPF0345 family)